MAVFYSLRLFMFLLSFVLQDWALHELLPDKARAINRIAARSIFLRHLDVPDAYVLQQH